MQNGKRGRREKEEAIGSESAEQEEKAEEGLPASPDEAMIEHVEMVTSLFEGRDVSREEVLEMLKRAEMRQQGIGGEENGEYRVRDPKDDTS